MSRGARPVLSAAIALAVVVAASACGRPKVDKDGKPVTVGSLRLHTFPAGAKVWIDGVPKIDATPATIVLPAGKYDLRLQLAGARSLERTIEIEAGEAKELTIDLPTPPEATIAVRSDVVGADVRINGYRRGATPLGPVITRPGPVDLTITSPMGRAKGVRTRLEIGEQKVLEVFFDDVASLPEEAEKALAECRPEPMGFLTLGLKPDGAVFTEDGRALGDTPLVRLAIRPGEHDLILRSLDGRYEKRVTVEVEADQTAVFRFQLRGEDQVPGWKPPEKRDAGDAG